MPGRIWDPYLAIGESRQNGRILVHAPKSPKPTRSNRQSRFRQESSGPVLQAIIDVTRPRQMGRAHREEVAKSLSAVTGIRWRSDRPR